MISPVSNNTFSIYAGMQVIDADLDARITDLEENSGKLTIIESLYEMKQSENYFCVSFPYLKTKQRFVCY